MSDDQHNIMCRSRIPLSIHFEETNEDIFDHIFFAVKTRCLKQLEETFVAAALDGDGKIVKALLWLGVNIDCRSQVNSIHPLLCSSLNHLVDFSFRKLIFLRSTPKAVYFKNRLHFIEYFWFDYPSQICLSPYFSLH